MGLRAVAEHYFIDGYNVVHRSSLLRPIAAQDLERAREMLVDKVICFCMTGNKEVTIVFDGREEEASRDRVERARNVAGFHVVYSPYHATADMVIERLIYREPKRLECVVVSNDQGLRSLCRGMGALTMEADHFLKIVREQQEDARNMISHARRGEAATLLQDRLNSDALQKLSALRDQLGKKKSNSGKET